MAQVLIGYNKEGQCAAGSVIFLDFEARVECFYLQQVYGKRVGQFGGIRASQQLAEGHCTRAVGGIIPVGAKVDSSKDDLLPRMISCVVG